MYCEDSVPDNARNRVDIYTIVNHIKIWSPSQYSKGTHEHQFRTNFRPRAIYYLASLLNEWWLYSHQYVDEIFPTNSELSVKHLSSNSPAHRIISDLSRCWFPLCIEFVGSRRSPSRSKINCIVMKRRNFELMPVSILISMLSLSILLPESVSSSSEPIKALRQITECSITY